jgi:hypothetical protein
LYHLLQSHFAVVVWNSQLYDQKSHVAAGKDDNWINGWINSFVKEHGMEKVSELLGNYFLAFALF